MSTPWRFRQTPEILSPLQHALSSQTDELSLQLVNFLLLLSHQFTDLTLDAAQMTQNHGKLAQRRSANKAFCGFMHGRASVNNVNRRE